MPDASKPDDFALAAARELDELAKDRLPQVGLSEADHLLRASVYQFNRELLRAHGPTIKPLLMRIRKEERHLTQFIRLGGDCTWRVSTTTRSEISARDRPVCKARVRGTHSVR
jgi:hypothetical protein